MISKNLYFQILVRVAILVTFSLLTGWALFAQSWYLIAAIFLVITGYGNNEPCIVF